MNATTPDQHKSDDPVQVARDIVEHCVATGGQEQAEAVARRAQAIGEIVAGLGVGATVTAAATVYPLLEQGLVSRRELRGQLADDTVEMARELVRLGQFSLPEQLESGLDARQAEALRKMLLSIIEDVRLVLVLLANQLDRMRSAKQASDNERHRVAMETREIFAPLANKLGVWQLKWELEDLAFRFLEADTYKTIAKQLKERRVEREEFIREVVATLQQEAEKLGVVASVEGRPKHIYSIWKKMQRKQLDFNHIFDIRAVRVLVESVADCYAILGAVHGRWPPVPGEFDDYIATPKENLYRSLHTAVIGPGQKTLEIQIRTHEMHAHAELGVAAHWKYKEGKARELSGSDAAFERKIRWVRSLLEPGDSQDAADDFIERFRADLFEDRVYALTPGGDIIDLPQGSTPLDFAYYVHTELGHRCRGAKVSGRIVPLTYKLTNGDQLEIITAKTGNPSRDWLIPQLGYLGSSRARTKVRSWFRRQDQQHNIEQGRGLLERELQRLGVGDVNSEQLARQLRLGNSTELYVALGTGDITVTEIAQAVQQRVAPDNDDEPELQLRAPSKEKESSIRVEGVGGLMTSYARCCRPVPPDLIAGYITVGRGVTIHRRLCANFLRLADVHHDRVLEVSWGGDSPSTYPVDVTIEAHDRKGLVKDISSLLSAEKINIVGMNTRTDKKTMSASFELTLEISGLEELSRIMLRISNLPNIVSVRRRS
ncbi:MAG: bifunctional (p)ppGpp synthetase/guanosine-3',5'-bis(diphosphate) 3'-pyrophosphohydrolase [Gammaproteobacteria bacterium]|nr:bifunctional (p)ppGpp synthetase/guanosine-3',5'-bis(diphosphate) 3'-pyrophosphohydrolase [Gammaproteobacteria bacterium]NNF61491.1 bifunctional (p)ppGpp synthetase/guanosine-3',5'-bis(diphosphate) 3'-pyrophosphohydrolase [Gammaproteobacteria bacterium]NNM20777.1 bifunctional (p)ppGpp synthetase/guanosine-3',5'-bis(diphosphate) 3'-pyrophosphohydrolase [Gammaproteobacteria bacterium]